MQGLDEMRDKAGTLAYGYRIGDDRLNQKARLSVKSMNKDIPHYNRHS
jgi:hypothetical protein